MRICKYAFNNFIFLKIVLHNNAPKLYSRGVKKFLGQECPKNTPRVPMSFSPSSGSAARNQRS